LVERSSVRSAAPSVVIFLVSRFARASGRRGQASGRAVRQALGVDRGEPVVGRLHQLVQVRERALDVELVQPVDDLGGRVHELRDRRRRAGDVHVVRRPRDRQRRRGRVDVVELEVARAGDALRRQPDAQAAIDFHLRVRRVGQVAGGRAPADQPRLDLRLDQNVARALEVRQVLLVDDVGERDLRHLADHHALELDLAAEVEALHRLVEVGLDRDLALEPSPRSDHQEHDDAADQRADHEQAKLEATAFWLTWPPQASAGAASHTLLKEGRAPSKRRAALIAAAFSGSRRRNARTRLGARVARLARISSAMMPRACCRADDAVDRREHARQVVRDDDEGHAEVLGEPAHRGVERRRRDRVEAGVRFVEEQDRRVERHRARDARALLHAARDLARQVAGEPVEADQRELHARDQRHRVVGQAGVDLDRQPHVLEQRHRAEQRARLVHDAEAAPDALERLAVGADDVLAELTRPTPAARGRSWLEDRAFAAARAAEDADTSPARTWSSRRRGSRRRRSPRRGARPRSALAGRPLRRAFGLQRIGRNHRAVRCSGCNRRRRKCRRRRRAG
jgi:hypothetical protein